tara:strand:+ start:1674 stop:2180 length:507 start_codon:yes stop_codon:yes gene_type:complete
MAWSKKNTGVVLTPEQTNYLNILASKLPFDIVVTSGFRTPEKQARAMFTKIELGDDLIALYKDDEFAQSVIDAYPDLDQGIQAVNDYVARGGGKTMHLSGNAVDIRTRDKTDQEIDLIISTVRSMGDRALYEPIPPHIDISFRNDYTPKKKPIVALVLVSGLLYFLFQ